MPAREEFVETEERGAPARATGSQGWWASATLVVLPVLCCGLPLLVAALVATGAGTWLAAHGYMVAAPVLGLATAFLVWKAVSTGGQG